MYVYAIPPIDFWGGWMTEDEFVSNIMQTGRARRSR